MRYIFYFFTIVLLFVGGMLVGNTYLPQRDTSLASSVSVPSADTTNPIFQEVTRERAQQNLEILNQALTACPVVVNEEKDRLLNQIKLRLALENFELKKLKLELEIAKNQETNRPTAEFIQASIEYKQAKERAEKLADELFPVVAAAEAEETSVQPQETAPTQVSSSTVTTEKKADSPAAAAKK